MRYVRDPFARLRGRRLAEYRKNYPHCLAAWGGVLYPVRERAAHFMVLEGFSERPADLPLPTLTHGILVSHRRIQTLQGVINFRGLYDFGVSVEWTPDEVACEVCDRVARILQKLTHEHRSFLLHEIDPELASQIWQAIVEVAFTQVERKVLRLNDFEDL